MMWDDTVPLPRPILKVFATGLNANVNPALQITSITGVSGEEQFHLHWPKEMYDTDYKTTSDSELSLSYPLSDM